ncbi:catalase family peroxidase [Hyalangium minutum]|uniref:Catalase-related peroxidase n=1 Tax=Hyalangium minutum TaxID=394096 RepID=A0A085VZ16_9BACT|nr:catalase family peroxidase [Hyalangium minutum]KFE58441.1 Catalase [Hyalangium minutum]KFE60679.1 Catalase [Hyalangium minutum]
MADPVQEAVDAMEKHTGTVQGYRRAHPRGLVFHATFTPTPEARPLTAAEHFQGPPVHTLVRFSNASGSPHAPDRGSDRQGAVLGLAVRFDLPSGKHATWAAANIPAFVARTPEEFLQVTRAQRPNASPHPLRMLGYILTHLHALPGIRGIVGTKPAPSFAHCQYNSVHAYHLVDAQGQRRAFRYRWVPSAGAATLSPAEARKRPEQYLLDELRERVSRERVTFNLVFQLANPGDPTHDATRPWPEDRQKIPAGQLVIDSLYEDQRESERFVFDPTGVVPGIELSDDPILHFRAKVYSESYNRRSSETKPEPKPADLRQ